MNSVRRPADNGFSMIELLVALAITALLIIGVVTMYSQSRNTFRAAEAVARLQENARYAMSFIETDIRMANYWGLNSRPDYIQLGGVATNACEAGWATNVVKPVEGFDGAKGLGCILDADYQTDSDVIVVRRAAADRETGTLTENAIYLQTSRVQGTLFVAERTVVRRTRVACPQATCRRSPRLTSCSHTPTTSTLTPPGALACRRCAACG